MLACDFLLQCTAYGKGFSRCIDVCVVWDELSRYQALRVVRVQCKEATGAVPAANTSQPQLMQCGILVIVINYKSLQQFRALIGQLLIKGNRANLNLCNSATSAVRLWQSTWILLSIVSHPPFFFFLVLQSSQCTQVLSCAGKQLPWCSLNQLYKLVQILNSTQEKAQPAKTKRGTRSVICPANCPQLVYMCICNTTSVHHSTASRNMHSDDSYTVLWELQEGRHKD